MSIATRVMNDEALRTAIRALAPTQAEGIEQLYVLLDDAQRKGYEQGAEASRASNNEYWEVQLEQERDLAWDQGYLQGVDDARRAPGNADTLVAAILADGVEPYAPAEMPVEDGQTYSDDDEALQAAWEAYDRQVFRGE